MFFSIRYPQTEYLAVVNLVETFLSLPMLRVKVGSALHWAAELGKADSLEQLLFHSGEERRYPIKLAIMKDERGYLPIHLAAKRGHTKCIKVLLKAKVEDHEATYVPLEEDEIYLEEDEDEESQNSEEDDDTKENNDEDDEEARREKRRRKKQKREALRQSKQAKEEEKKRKRSKRHLLDQVKRKDREGNTPLLHACANGHVETAKFLLKNGASLKDRNKRGMTCLLLASEGGLEMVYFLPPSLSLSFFFLYTISP